MLGRTGLRWDGEVIPDPKAMAGCGQGGQTKGPGKSLFSVWELSKYRFVLSIPCTCLVLMEELRVDNEEGAAEPVDGGYRWGRPGRAWKYINLLRGILTAVLT